MRFFFRSRQFKILLAVFIALLTVSAASGAVGGVIAPQSDFLGAIAAPFSSLGTNIAGGVSSFFSAYKDGRELGLENARLRAEIDELQKQIADYDKAASENEFYKDYLDIKDNHPDFKFADASVIARDPDDPYGGFVINKGSLSDIQKYDPVITSAGVVGYITEVGLTTCKVTTLLSRDLTMGAIDNRTTDSGIVSGALEFARDGQCKFYNLARSSNIAVGDYVVTSGEGIFPAGLLIGTIENIGSDKYSPSIFAGVKPFVDLKTLRTVMVITEFEGQGGIAPESSGTP